LSSSSTPLSASLKSAFWSGARRPLRADP
jgi:hypothetical protein